MAKIVVMAKGVRFQLTDEHVEWLRANGYPDADYFFCKEDRSNPALIQCIEAIHATKQDVMDEAMALWREYRSKSNASREEQKVALNKLENHCEKHSLSWAFGKFVVEDGFKVACYDETRFMAEIILSWTPLGDRMEEVVLTPYISNHN